MTLYRYPTPILTEPCRPVTEFGPGLEAIVAEMKQSREDIDRLGVSAVGLAANQVGIPLRVFVWRHAGSDHVVVNPEIVSRSGTQFDNEECLSLLGPFSITKARFDAGLSLQVQRSAEISVHAQNVDGERIIIGCQGYLARMFQHEIDHLDGLTILDRVSAPVRKQALKKFRALHPTDESVAA